MIPLVEALDQTGFGSAAAGHRRDSGCGPGDAGQAAAHGQADLERLRNEYDYTRGYTMVKDHVRLCKARRHETFVPLGHTQVEFGEAVMVVGGERMNIHYSCMSLPQSDACFVKAYPRVTTKAFLDGHVSAYAFFEGVPLSILYDNTTIAVAKIRGDGTRERTSPFTELVSHHLFWDRFGRPARGDDKSKVEGW